MNIIDLWLPILVSAVIVFFASAVVWTVLKWHDSDYRKTADEEAVRAALRGAAPGMYTVPHAMTEAERKDPALKQKFIDGPQAYITVVPNGVPQMGGKLIASFVYNIFVGVLCAYFVSRMLAPDASYLQVFRMSGTVAWVAYGIAYIQESIWFGRPWIATVKSLGDALIYSLLTGGTFGWLA